MFCKGSMREDGIDITIKNNPDHVLAPDNWDMVLGVKFGKITPAAYKKWYADLIRKRWEERRDEIVELAKEGLDREVKLLCYCPHQASYCHAHLASKFLNKLVLRLKQDAKEK